MAPSSNNWGTNSPRKGCRGTGKRDGFFDRHRSSHRRSRDCVRAAARSVHAPRFDVKTDISRDALLTEFGKETLRDRYLLPGENYQDLFARVAAAYADDAEHAQRVYDYISKLWFMPATPVLSQRRHRPRPSDQLLSEQRLRQPRGHRRHLERECLAGQPSGGGIGTYWGQRPRHRRAGRPQRQDQRHHPVRPGDGQPDAGDQPGLAAPRLGRLLPRHQSPRDRGIPRDPQTLGRLQPQGAQPPPRRARHRRVHGGGARRRRVPAEVAQGPERPRHGRRPLAVPEAGRDPPRDRRAVHHLHRRGEPVDAQASPRPRPQGHDFEPLLGNHAADRQGPSRRRPHRGLLPVSSLSLETWDEWNKDKRFIEDVMRFLDNVLSDYIARAPDEMARAKYSAERERSSASE